MDGKISARLLGDFAAYTDEQRDLGATKYLFVPSQPASHPRYLSGMDSWLLVDKADVTLDGTVCNKIGTAYTAFRNQANKCSQPASSCLANQLEDMQLVDDARIQQGEAPIRRMSAFGDFSPYIGGTGDQFVAFREQLSRSSVITLTLAADDMRFIIAESPGRIDSVLVRDFEAQSNDGRLLVVVTNTGRLNADYSLRVVCTIGILQLQARPLSLTPSQQRSISFALHTESAVATGYACNVQLYGSARMSLLDQKNVSFETTALVENRGAQSGEYVSGADRSDERGDLALISACSHWCTTFYNVPCFITFGCTSKLGRFVLIVIVVLLGCCCCCKRRLRQKVLLRHCCADDHRATMEAQRERRWRGLKLSWKSASCSETPEKKRSFANHCHALQKHTFQTQHSAWVRRDRRQPPRPSQSAASQIAATKIPRKHIVYLNVSKDRALVTAQSKKSGLAYPGAEFSLRGELVMKWARDQDGRMITQHYFWLGRDARQFWRWSSARYQYTFLQSPNRLSQEFFCLNMHNPDGSLCIASSRTISTRPMFPCINTRTMISGQAGFQERDASGITGCRENETVDSLNKILSSNTSDQSSAAIISSWTRSPRTV